MLPLIDKSRQWFTTLAALVALVGTAGCGSDRYPVSGQVVFEDGSPLTEGTVLGETGEGDATVIAQGSVRNDGTFTWGSDRPGDGAKPGEYRVAVIPRALGDGEIAKGILPAVDQKFANVGTSGIRVEVKPGKNELPPITVSKPKKRTR
jgi:hypothetical protein